MAKLIFTLDGVVLDEYPLNKQRISIGRRPASDIHIDSLAVSGEHAAILTVGKDAFLEDLNSTNGTLVNRKRIKKQMLQHGDLIEFSNYKLTYVKEDKDLAADIGVSGAAMLVGRITVLDGPSAGKELLLSKAITTLGNPEVQTATISKLEHGYSIAHVGGVNHLKVSDQPVGVEPCQLRNHDVIELAGVKMRFYLSES